VRDSLSSTSLPAPAGRAWAVRAWLEEAAPLSATLLALLAVYWLLRLVPALDVELPDLEEHERPPAGNPPRS
jgi:hypothetical protein